MTTFAGELREAIFSRVSLLRGFAKYRKTSTPQLQPTDLPCVTVAIVSEADSPDGDGNVGAIAFICDATIGVSVVRGFKDPDELECRVDRDIGLIRTKLFTDPTFVHFEPDTIFEEITQVTTRRVRSQDGETYFCEGRMEITFRRREVFEPVIPDDYEGMTVRVRPLQNPDAPIITAHWDVSAE
jgi:hypothetical protein